ncbi:MAG: SCO family protein [Acidobacteriota bacterium]|nr:SCO family protein [Acidobacteriota bacterium]
MRLVTAPASMREAHGRIGRGLVIGIVLAAVGLGAGIGIAVHALTQRSPLLRPAAIISMRHGLYGDATWAARAVPAPPIGTIHDQTGGRFALSSLHGHSVALAFFDSHCHQECPLEGRQLAAAERTLPAAQRPTLVVVSVNPKDTRASATKAIREWGLAGVAPWHWLMGTHSQLARIWAAYNIQVSPPINGDINHTEALYLIDRHGDERAAYLWPFASRFATYDMRALARRKGA